MKFTRLLSIFSAAIFSLLASTASAAPKACSSVTPISSGAVAYKNSAPVRACSAHTCPIERFRHDPTLLFKTKGFPSFSCQILDKKGNQLASCPRQSAIGFAGGRCRCSYSNERMTEAVRRRAIANTGSPQIYFRLGSKCVEIPDAGRCYGVQVRELCATTLK